jgi:hypothetical protein
MTSEEFKDSMFRQALKRVDCGEPLEEIIKHVYEMAYKDGFRNGKLEEFRSRLK